MATRIQSLSTYSLTHINTANLVDPNAPESISAGMLFKTIDRFIVTNLEISDLAHLRNRVISAPAQSDEANSAARSYYLAVTYHIRNIWSSFPQGATFLAALHNDQLGFATISKGVLLRYFAILNDDDFNLLFVHVAQNGVWYVLDQMISNPRFHNISRQIIINAYKAAIRTTTPTSLIAKIIAQPNSNDILNALPVEKRVFILTKLIFYTESGRLHEEHLRELDALLGTTPFLNSYDAIIYFLKQLSSYLLKESIFRDNTVQYPNLSHHMLFATLQANDFTKARELLRNGATLYPFNHPDIVPADQITKFALPYEKLEDMQLADTLHILPPPPFPEGFDIYGRHTVDYRVALNSVIMARYPNPDDRPKFRGIVNILHAIDQYTTLGLPANAAARRVYSDQLNTLLRFVLENIECLKPDAQIATLEQLEEIGSLCANGFIDRIRSLYLSNNLLQSQINLLLLRSRDMLFAEIALKNGATIHTLQSYRRAFQEQFYLPRQDAAEAELMLFEDQRAAIESEFNQKYTAASITATVRDWLAQDRARIDLFQALYLNRPTEELLSEITGLPKSDFLIYCLVELGFLAK